VRHKHGNLGPVLAGGEKLARHAQGWGAGEG
jgi:hypothetical protein